MCGATQDTAYQWTRADGSQSLSSNTGPHHVGDKTSGGSSGYLYLECSNRPSTDIQGARLKVGSLSSGTACLRFYYFMFGLNVNSLNVIVGDSIAFARSGDQGERWIEAEVSLSASEMSSIYIEATGCSYYDGDIAIDDVQLFSGSCD